MNNREKDKKFEKCHLFVALRRKKENKDLPEICIREIIKDESREIDFLDIVKVKTKHFPGIWRIYKTVNSRNIEPARKLLMKKLIDEPDRFEFRIDSLWKNCLLQKECRGERNLMIDVDSNELPIKLKSLIDTKKIIPKEIIKTPNGYHLIFDKIDSRLIDGIQNIELKRDDLKFICKFEVK